MSSLTIFRTLLTASAKFVALVPPEKQFPIEAPQSVKPDYIVLNIVGGRDRQTLAGAARYYEGRVSIEFLSDNGTRALHMGDVALEVLEDVTKQTVAGFTDVDVKFADIDISDSASDRSMFRRILQFRSNYRIPA